MTSFLMVVCVFFLWVYNFPTTKENTQSPLTTPLSVCNLMMQGVAAIYGPFPMQSSDVIRSYSDTFHMPFISSEVAVNVSEAVRGKGTRSKESYQFYVRPSYAYAMVDFMRHYNWQSLWYLFDSDEGGWNLCWCPDVA